MPNFKWIYSFLILLIIGISYSFFSYVRFPLLSSDDALSVLMAVDYDFTKDVYCWGQNRGGTLIPAMASLGIKCGLSPLNAVSICAFGVFTLGFFGFSQWFKTYWVKICFALLWFLPFERFMDISRFPMGLGYSLVGIVAGCLYKFSVSSGFWKYVYVITMSIGTLLAIWLLDTAALSCLLLWICGYFGVLKQDRVTYLIFGIFTFIGVAGFVFWAKSHAISFATAYTQINSIEEIKQAFVLIFKAWWKEMVFDSPNFIVGICVWILLPFLVFIGFGIVKLKIISIKLIKSNFFYFFLLFDFIGMLFVFILSSWTLANGMGRWYFVGTYIIGCVLCLMVIEQLWNKKPSNRIKWSIIFISLLTASSSFYTLGFTRNKSFKPMVKSIKEWNMYAPLGIIGEYWNSYINKIANVNNIAVTPHELSDVRNKKYVEEVFKKPRLFIVKDMWLDSFPNQMKQFNRELKIKGKPFKIAGSMVCEYELLKKL